jgi:hypothetical protein
VSILVTLAGSNEDLIAAEIDVLDPQHQAFHFRLEPAIGACLTRKLETGVSHTPKRSDRSSAIVLCNSNGLHAENEALRVARHIEENPLFRVFRGGDQKEKRLVIVFVTRARELKEKHAVQTR